jgi:repressor LexA
MNLTRRQSEIYRYLVDNAGHFDRPPTYDELCEALGLASRGSLHKHIQALVHAGLVEPMDGSHRGIRLVEQEEPVQESAEAGVPYLGTIAAGRPIEAIPQADYLQVPAELTGSKPCYVLKVSGDSMIEEGILDGDYVVIEQRDSARNGEIVVALLNGEEVTLKRIEQTPAEVILHPANIAMMPVAYPHDAVQIQGVLRGLLRSYR